MKSQRPFWPAVLVCSGSLLMSGSKLVFDCYNYPTFVSALSSVGLVIAMTGLLLSARYFISRKRLAMHSLNLPPTKAV